MSQPLWPAALAVGPVNAPRPAQRPARWRRRRHSEAMGCQRLLWRTPCGAATRDVATGATQIHALAMILNSAAASASIGSEISAKAAGPAMACFARGSRLASEAADHPRACDALLVASLPFCSCCISCCLCAEAKPEAQQFWVSQTSFCCSVICCM